MDICNEKHDDIVYDGGNCPLCEYIETAEKFKEEVEQATNEAEDALKLITDKLDEAEQSGVATSDLWIRAQAGKVEEKLSELKGLELS